MRRSWRIGVLFAVAGVTEAAAQADCYPPADSHEAQTLAIYSVPLAYSAAASPLRMTAGRVQVGLELSSLPTIDSVTATPTVCRPGKGPENTDLLFAFPRPRVLIALPAGFTVDASWVPPVRVSGVKANLFGIGLGKAFALGAQVTLRVRAHGTFGRINAPITCGQDALADPNSECYQGTLSDDRYQPNIFGLDLATGFSLAGGKLSPYLGGGYNRLQPRFQVNFTNSAGETDNRKVIVDLNRAVLFGGMTWAASRRIHLSGELYGALGDAVTGRLLAQASIGNP